MIALSPAWYQTPVLSISYLRGHSHTRRWVRNGRIPPLELIIIINRDRLYILWWETGFKEIIEKRNPTRGTLSQERSMYRVLIQGAGIYASSPARAARIQPSTIRLSCPCSSPARYSRSSSGVFCRGSPGDTSGA